MISAVRIHAAPIIQPPSESYEDLVCTEQDQAAIYEIITTMSEYGKCSLLWNQKHLRELGAKIAHVHPLKFLSTILNDSQLRESLVNIFGDCFKRNAFMYDLGSSLTRAEKEKYIQPFADDVKVSKASIECFFKKQDWEGLVRFFIQSSSS